ncbi:MAG: efflux RND transporter periplasmic adaptor subunit [Hyphomicrobiales bacterium]|nr:efflux RND transporter periplasmic adaptor subunit [Hyphomicrobiales bacterium]MBV8428541.1 efflux RND transporter periplasmic adaptor subunit [Hyphomicrobiales bacterium]
MKTIVILAALLSLSACNENHYVAPPAPKVTVAHPLRQEITRYLETSGNLASVNSTNLVARVAGFVQEVKFKDGETVKAGQPLFVVEPQPYEIALEQAKAAEASADATVTQAQADYARQTQLQRQDFASKATLESSTATRDSALAVQRQKEADTKQAEINLGYTQVKAPFDGIVTARQVSVGELVGMGSPTVLATVVQLDPIYVNFNVSEQDVVRLRAGIRERGTTEAELRQMTIEVGLVNETGYPHKGTLDYAYPGVTSSTGTLAVRGVLPNPDRILLPGYFVRIRVPLSKEPDTLLVPDTAIGNDQGGRYVLLVGKDGIVEQRKIEIGETRGDLRIVTQGLSADDSVIVSGVARAVPGQKVEAEPQTLARSGEDGEVK